MPYKKNNIRVTVPHSSGSDLSHRNSGTIQCGTLTPLLVEEVIPKTRCHLRIPEIVQLPPLVTDAYMNLKLKHEAFFVPMRLCCRSFENWFSEFPKRVAQYNVQSGASVTSFYDVKAALPVFQLDSTLPSNYYSQGSLLDFLGYKIDRIQGNEDISPLSMIAYHLIWQEYYRNPRVQNPAFVPEMVLSTTSSSNYRVPSLPFYEFRYAGTGISANNVYVANSTNVASQFNCADGTSIFSLRQRNFGLDYFTGARVSPQQGTASSVSMSIPSGATSTSFTIAQLRAANSLQQFRERNNLPSSRFVDQIYARYGVVLSDGVAQRPIFIGSSTFDVVTRGVDQTSPGGVASQPNPFNTVGSNYGKAYAVGDGTLIDDFEVKEPGFIMVIQSLVPEVTYSSGIAPYLKRYLADGSVVEMATPVLQNIGDEPIYDWQLGDTGGNTASIFGYQDRYGTFMFHSNECHSEFRDGNTLDTFVLQRSFGSGTTLNSSFLEIPTNYLDQLFVTSAQSMGFSAWYDAKLEWKITHPLQEFSIPSLQDPAYEHGQSISIRRNGQIL